MYLLDTNIYISFYDRYYPKENFPTFWNEFTKILNTDIVIPKVIMNENYQSKWFVEEYLANNFKQAFVNHKEYMDEWGAVLQHVSESSYYNENALISERGWANERIADGWLIAIAQKENYTIVTDEVKNPNLNRVNPSKNCKIPDVAADLGVNCISMLNFFKEIGLKI
ncbi:DUF4411 family protein [Enterococcus sp. 22-H-5-01]|uniref:DUF4411 family protein n=1 Tax=Enterococcus sp. 22-H-5-01 TaxID=3418555 RepID=UPI003D0234F0